MWQSLRISNLVLRFSLAIVFLWFGLDKFFHPNYWITAWLPSSVTGLGAFFHLSVDAIIYSIGVVELLIGISFVSNMFVDFFAIVAVVILVGVSFFYGFNEVLIRDVGLVGALLALVFWPHPRYR